MCSALRSRSYRAELASQRTFSFPSVEARRQLDEPRARAPLKVVLGKIEQHRLRSVRHILELSLDIGKVR